MYSARDVAEVLRGTAQFLSFKAVVPDLKRLGPLYLAVGLIFAWLVGIGRYWDNPRAALWQHLGLGSVAYVFVMALLIWIILLPLRPMNWRFLNVIVFIALTSPPALLYAIPVESFLSIGAAKSVNVLFLATVALWRVILLWKFLHRSADLRGYELFVAVFLPIVLVVITLTMLNLEHVVFSFMAGIPADQVTANDAAYRVLLTITFLSIFAFPILLVSYLWMCLD